MAASILSPDPGPVDPSEAWLFNGFVLPTQTHSEIGKAGEGAGPFRETASRVQGGAGRVQEGYRVGTGWVQAAEGKPCLGQGFV